MEDDAKHDISRQLATLREGGDGDARYALGSARRLARYAACTAQAVGGASLIAYDSFNASKCFDVALNVLHHVPEIATALPRDYPATRRGISFTS